MNDHIKKTQINNQSTNQRLNYPDSSLYQNKKYPDSSQKLKRINTIVNLSSDIKPKKHSKNSILNKLLPRIDSESNLSSKNSLKSKLVLESRERKGIDLDEIKVKIWDNDYLLKFMKIKSKHYQGDKVILFQSFIKNKEQKAYLGQFITVQMKMLVLEEVQMKFFSHMHVSKTDLVNLISEIKKDIRWDEKSQINQRKRNKIKWISNKVDSNSKNVSEEHSQYHSRSKSADKSQNLKVFEQEKLLKQIKERNMNKQGIDNF